MLLAVVCVSRANDGAMPTASASTAPRAPTPKTSARNSASSRPGKAIIRLKPATISRPSRRPTTSGSEPTTTPTPVPISVASSASSSESRLATSVRASTSRPSASVPKGCAADMPDCSASTSVSTARPPNSGGPRTAASSSSASSATVMIPSGLRSRWG